MVLVLIPIIVSLIPFFIYNGLIGKKNEVSNALGGLDAQLKQRYDLIPNLVSSVKQYMKHESKTLEKIVELRTQCLKLDIPLEEKQELNKEISKSISGLLVQVENYPELKANHSFIKLQDTLLSVEESIAAARRFYNSAVTDYNNALEMFPSNVLAKWMKLQRKEVFTIPETERANVNVENLFEEKAS